ncbi:MAG: methyltransferase [Gemmatimonadota bacterium]
MDNPMALLETIRSFMKSRIILTGVELDLFTRVSQGLDTTEALAGRAGLDLRATTRLLDALVTHELLEKSDGRYRLTDAGTFLAADHPRTVLPMALHMNELWRTWSGLTAAVTHGANPGRVASAARDEGAIRAFIGAMHVVGERLSREISASLDLSSFGRLLDVGGASGTYTIAFLESNPQMTAVIFDLAHVIGMARDHLTRAGLADRVALVSGDFYTDPLPQGCDLGLLSAIIHQNSPGQNEALFRKVYQALEPDGMLIIRDHIMDADRTHPPDGAIFALNMLVGTEGGDTHTFEDVQQGLAAAGFTDIRLVRRGENMDCLVTARKPN